MWEVMDICDMKGLKDNTFDFVFDKSTIDALLCGENSFVNVARMLKETQRVLKPGGNYFAVSYGKPESRSFHFEQEFLSFDTREFVVYDEAAVTAKEKEEKTHYIYVCTKKPDADQVMAANFEKVIIELIKQEEEVHPCDEKDEDSDSPKQANSKP